jgi:ATP-dependent Lhr-like helicase
MGTANLETMSQELDCFFPPLRLWFQETFPEPTLPQKLGWPAIQRGENVLILAPTGSGKTFAAFLWGISRLCERLSAGESLRGVQVLYVSPLKALNNDIERNLKVPLAGSRALAGSRGLDFPEVRMAVRTGDTPSKARLAMAKHPPHILITTPESLYLLLASPHSRQMFRSVQTVIVDEIHTVCGNKRGVHLSLSLERLEHLADRSLQRIGLSATQRPLEEVARFLGGQRWIDEGNQPRLKPREVRIIDASFPRPLDLEVTTVVPDFQALPVPSVWPLVIPRIADLIRAHRTTLIFCNNRRLAEKTADRLNAQLSAKESGDVLEKGLEPLIQDGIPVGLGALGFGAAGGPIRAHHGSMSRDARQQMEEDLKSGRLPALVGTSSLELGIDVGSIDLVVQIQSPKGVAQGLQRVGRSGHLVGQTSKGRILTTHREDVLEAAAVARGMLRGEIESTKTPQNSLDVLAQQIVAAVGVESWRAGDLYGRFRQSYAYRDLSREVYDSVLSMISGRFGEVYRPRISWDKLHDALHPLPGSRMVALSNVGTIPDRGTFGAYLLDGKTKIGELDEEFVFETRVGDAFMLGSQTWRVAEITPDRVLVVPAPDSIPRMPFWRGDLPWRHYELGLAVGRFRREVASRIDDPHLAGWLKEECALDENSTRCVISSVRDQLEAFGATPSDNTVIVETFQDAVGEPRMVVHSPFGGRVNGPWGIALSSALSERFGISGEVLSNDDGIILRFPATGAELLSDIVEKMGPQEARERLLSGLADSALFGAQFRMNAARALLLPKGRPGRRTPFWLQRLKAKDLLARVRQVRDFPILAETYRDCLEDVMDVRHLEEVLERIQRGEIKVVKVESVVPSPVALGLISQFAAVYLYEWDAPKAERQLAALSVSREYLQSLLKDVSLADLLQPETLPELEGWLQHTKPESKARTQEELALLLQELGDLTADEIRARCTDDAQQWVRSLIESGRVAAILVPTSSGLEERYILAEDQPTFALAFSPPQKEGVGFRSPDVRAARRALVERLLRYHGPLTIERIRQRYDFPGEWLGETLGGLTRAGKLMQGQFSKPPSGSEGALEWIDITNLERLHRRSLTVLRAQVHPVSPAAYACFLHRWQHLTPEGRMPEDALRPTIEQMSGLPIAGPLWERDILPTRVPTFAAVSLNDLLLSGSVVWQLLQGRIRFFPRGEGRSLGYWEDVEGHLDAFCEPAGKIHRFLQEEGASYSQDIGRLPKMSQSDLEAGLGELVNAGLVTGDTLEMMRWAIVAPASASPDPSLAGSLHDELERRLARRLVSPSRRLRDARRTRQTIALRVRRAAQLAGRWSLLRRAAILGPSVTLEERASRQAGVLLSRYGVFFSELLEGETWTVEWPAIRRALQILELRGEVRRGYFVEGLSGMQYALPQAVEILRDPSGLLAETAPVVLNACDPANISGRMPYSEPTVNPARVPSNYLAFWRGKPVVAVETGGESISSATGLEQEALQDLVEVLVNSVYRTGKVSRRVLTWNGVPIIGSPGEQLLRPLGFHRVPRGLAWGG